MDGRESVVSVTDRSGRVQDVEFDPLDADAGGGVAIVPGQPNKLDIPWTGGVVRRVDDIEIAGPAPVSRSRSRSPRTTGTCDAMGVGKAIRLKLDQPIPPAMVAVAPVAVA